MNPLSDFETKAQACRGGVVAIGNFDGVHRGHALLIDRLVDMGKRLDGPTVVVTFQPHPLSILHPGPTVMPLTDMPRRIELLKRLGVEHVLVCQSSHELLSLTAEEFFSKFIHQSLRAIGMVEGPNFYFGKDRRGDVALLSRLCQAVSIHLEIVPPQLQGPEMISSSRIRRLLELGEVRDAGALLTQPYQMRGIVVAGAARGRSLGFPTANLSEIPVLIPGAGVYAGRAFYADRVLRAAIHLGPNPTFSQGPSKVEVHLLDFSGNLYGQVLQVDFLDKVRDIARFASVDELQSQIARDLNRIRELVKE